MATDGRTVTMSWSTEERRHAIVATGVFTNHSVPKVSVRIVPLAGGGVPRDTPPPNPRPDVDYMP